MTRTNVVTGAASGIGSAAKELLEQRGETVIGVDLAGTDIDADLTTAEGRAMLVSEVGRRSGGSIDAVFAVAGLALPVPATVGVNYFGMIATLEGLRPLLATSDAPRAVAVTSMASLFPVDDELSGVADPIVTAYLLAWLGGVENTHLCGQVVFVDGGSDIVIRGDSTW